jgi:hypothetical protein
MKVDIAERLAEISAASDEKALLAIAYCTEADMKSGQMEPADYAQAMVLLAERLGFGITPYNLAVHAHVYLLEFCACDSAGLGGAIVIDGVGYTTCPSCCKPIAGTGKKATVPIGW